MIESIKNAPDGTIRTFTGKYFDPFNPDPDLICIEDIAHALSLQCRFSGHTHVHYSVARHSLNVLLLCEKKEYRLQALLHDASEAYLVDIPTPIKKCLPQYIDAEHNLMCVIAEKFGFDWPVSDYVKQLVRISLDYEWNNNVINDNCNFISFKNSELLFIEQFKILST